MKVNRRTYMYVRCRVFGIRSHVVISDLSLHRIRHISATASLTAFVNITDNVISSALDLDSHMWIVPGDLNAETQLELIVHAAPVFS